jgi:DNA-binding LacI/PurR family transcriptional regulator
MNDMMAIGAIRAIQDAGLRVPEDIAVIGYDDMRFAAFTNPALTTVRAPEIVQGRGAAKMVLRLVEGKAINDLPKMLSTELVVRASCGARG